MSWLTIIIVAFKVIDLVIDHLEKQNTLNDAIKQIVGEWNVKMAKRLGIVEDIKKRIDAMSDDDVDKRLSERGDFRD